MDVKHKLYYSKVLFSKKDIIAEKNKLAFAELWKLKDTKKDWVLEFCETNGLSKTKKGIKVNGFVFHRHPPSPSKKRDGDFYNEEGLMRVEVSNEKKK